MNMGAYFIIESLFFSLTSRQIAAIVMLSRHCQASVEVSVMSSPANDNILPSDLNGQMTVILRMTESPGVRYLYPRTHTISMIVKAVAGIADLYVYDSDGQPVIAVPVTANDNHDESVLFIPVEG
jgi:hypothetical protein